MRHLPHPLVLALFPRRRFPSVTPSRQPSPPMGRAPSFFSRTTPSARARSGARLHFSLPLPFFWSCPFSQSEESYRPFDREGRRKYLFTSEKKGVGGEGERGTDRRRRTSAREGAWLCPYMQLHWRGKYYVSYVECGCGRSVVGVGAWPRAVTKAARRV